MIKKTYRNTHLEITRAVSLFTVRLLCILSFSFYQISFSQEQESVNQAGIKLFGGAKIISQSTDLVDAALIDTQSSITVQKKSNESSSIDKDNRKIAKENKKIVTEKRLSKIEQQAKNIKKETSKFYFPLPISKENYEQFILTRNFCSANPTFSNKYFIKEQAIYIALFIYKEIFNLSQKKDSFIFHQFENQNFNKPPPSFLFA